MRTSSRPSPGSASSPSRLVNIVGHRRPEGGVLMPKLPGLVKGLGVTFGEHVKTLKAARQATVQYPHEKEEPTPRARGVIALKEENCTVCMLCARECPDWCIYIEGHKYLAPPRRRGRQAPSEERARPLRHRLLALHVLRDLRRGVPVRGPVLEPRVRVLRAPHRRPAPRQGPLGRVDGDGARTSRPTRPAVRDEGQEGARARWCAAEHRLLAHRRR